MFVSGDVNRSLVFLVRSGAIVDRLGSCAIDQRAVMYDKRHKSDEDFRIPGTEYAIPPADAILKTALRMYGS